MFEYDEDSKKAAQKLDEYDFTDILKSCFDSDIRDAYDIRNFIGEKHYPELEDTLADLTESEWIEYLEARYPVRFEEVVRYRMWYRQPN